MTKILSHKFIGPTDEFPNREENVQFEVEVTDPPDGLGGIVFLDEFLHTYSARSMAAEYINDKIQGGNQVKRVEHIIAGAN